MQNQWRSAGLGFMLGMTLAATAQAEPVKSVKIDVPQRAGAGASRNELVRQCRQVTRAVGPVSRYRSGDRELSAAELRDCNSLAISMASPRN